MHQALNEECSRLVELRRLRPTPERWEEAIRALNSKYEGVQVHAARVLGEWGGQRSTTLLKEWLVRNLEREAGWSAVGVATRELRRCVILDDSEWILELYFTAEDVACRHSLLGLAVVLPSDLLRERAAIESGSSDPRRQAAAKVLLNRLRYEQSGESTKALSSRLR
jgi:hypothetical protein